jgi:hypothetical protein
LQYFLDDFGSFENLVKIWTRRPPNYHQNISTNTRKIWNHFQKYYLQATASAADPSGIRRIDVWIQSALVSSVSSAGQIIGRPVVVRQWDNVINMMR